MKGINEGARNRDWTRMFEILRDGPLIVPVAGGKHLRLDSGVASIEVALDDLSRLAAKGLIKRQGERIKLTAEGENLMPRTNHGGQIRVAGENAESMPVARNIEESPLAALGRRRDANGRPFLDQRQHDAGERLRTDFAMAHMEPRVSANWQASVSDGRRAGSTNGIETATTSSLAARQRMEAALSGLGPDLAGVATDICCFLKGFEQVEMERQWPRRSAKFMLRAALSILAEHYSPLSRKGARKAHHWGADGYRPVIR